LSAPGGLKADFFCLLYSVFCFFNIHAKVCYEELIFLKKCISFIYKDLRLFSRKKLVDFRTNHANASNYRGARCPCGYLSPLRRQGST
jgi:hypothetical protein